MSVLGSLLSLIAPFVARIVAEAGPGVLDWLADELRKRPTTHIARRGRLRGRNIADALDRLRFEADPRHHAEPTGDDG